MSSLDRKIAAARAAAEAVANESVEDAVAVCSESWSLPPGVACRSRLHDPSKAQRCAVDCRARRRDRLDAVGETTPAGQATDDAVSDALDRCVVGVVDGSSPTATCKFAGVATWQQQFECDARCADLRRWENLRRAAMRDPLSQPPTGNGL